MSVLSESSMATAAAVTTDMSYILPPMPTSTEHTMIPPSTYLTGFLIPTPHILATAVDPSATASAATISDAPRESHKPWDINFGGDTAEKYLNDAKHAADIGSQFTICLVAGLIFFIAFCYFRTRVTTLFSPRSNMKRHKPPDLPKSFLGWIWPLLKIGDEEMLNNVGLDALLMLKFITMGIKIFGVCTIFGIIVFIPITMTSDASHIGNSTSTLDRLSINIIEEDSHKLIAYLVFAYVFTLVTFFFLNQSYSRYIYLRAKFLLNQSKKNLVTRSVLVTGLPDYLQSDEALTDYYEHLGIGPVESCYVVRTVYRLSTLIKKRANALTKLEEAYAKYWGNPCKIPGYDPDRILDDVGLYKKVLDLAEQRESDSSSSSDEDEDSMSGFKRFRRDSGTVPDKNGSLVPKDAEKLRRRQKFGNTTFFKGLIEPLSNKEGGQKKSKRPTVRVGGFLGIGGKKVDAIEYYTKLFDDLDKEVLDRRKSPHYEMTSVGIVTFKSMSSSVIASQIAINPEPFRCRTVMAYEPRDIIWDSIYIRGRERIIREAIIWTVTVLLCLTWFIPVGAISSLLSIETIMKINPKLGAKLASNKVAKLIFGSFIPPLVLNIFTSILPTFFDMMGYYQGLRARSAVAETTLSKQYFFLIFFTLIFYSVVGTTLLTIASDFANDPKKIPEFLAIVLPELAPFFINYTLLQGFLIMPLNLLLLGAIIIRGFNQAFLCKTPRQYAQNRAPWAFNYGIGYPAPLLVFAIVFEYSLICPLILLFGTMYFCFTYVVYKYQFLYVYFRPYEAAGKLWTMIIPRVVFTLLLFQLTMLGLFLLRTEYVLGGCVVPLIGLTFLFNFILQRAYRHNAHNLPMQLLRDNYHEEEGSDPETESDECDSDVDHVVSSRGKKKKEEEKRKNEREGAVLEATTGSGDTSTASATVPTIRIVPDPDDQKQQQVRNRWKQAALSAVKLKPEPISLQETNSSGHLARPRHSKVILDEDDYEATPDKYTDHRQPPMNLNPGILDSGLKKYGNPVLVGILPQLWLPVKDATVAKKEADTAAKAAEVGQGPDVDAQKRIVQNRRRKDFLRNDGALEGGGNLAKRLASMLRKEELNRRRKRQHRLSQANPDDTDLEQLRREETQEDLMMEEARRTAHDYAATIVSDRRRSEGYNTLSLRNLFKRAAVAGKKQSPTNKDGDRNQPSSAEAFRLEHVSNKEDRSNNGPSLGSADDATIDSLERGYAPPL
ncbi:hypothetical protein BDF20DRAFT_883871 [Mycotypha africana]|uniref:uncharacterized protein n=1 Tax=Mycotypha africana TaxID=64632 RepID=UPI002301B425|nr:uncharacterized protein BDF20DRAFT_883871 [Mycotypha africana]KAI8973738.1 hypothetical protein BDF20DRAFT_883871 [Mycotypha africana]